VLHHDAPQDQDADQLTHVHDEGLFYEINEVKDLDLRLNTETTSWKILVSLLGMEDIENTWIPLVHLWKGIPQFIYHFKMTVTNKTFVKK
jgi:hypothetical protein